MTHGVTDSKRDVQAEWLMKSLLSVVGSERKVVDGVMKWSQCQPREKSARECGLKSF